MGTFRKFEDIVAWQKARQVYRLILLIDFRHDFRLESQAKSAASSVMLNIAEGFASRTDLEFAQGLNIARRSASEVQAALYAALDAPLIDNACFQRIYDLCEEGSKMCLALSRYLRGRAERTRKTR